MWSTTPSSVTSNVLAPLALIVWANDASETGRDCESSAVKTKLTVPPAGAENVPVQLVATHGNVCGVVLFTETETVVVEAGTNIGRRAVADVALCARLIVRVTGAKPCGPAVGFVTGAPAALLVCGATEPPPPPPPHALTRK